MTTFEHYFVGWKITQYFFAVAFAFMAGRRIHWSVAPAVGLLLLSAIKTFNINDTVGANSQAAFSLLLLVCVFAFTKPLFSWVFLLLGSIAATIFAVNAIAFHGHNFFFGNGSMLGCFVAYFATLGPASFVVALVTAFCIGASAPFLAIGAGALGWCVAARKWALAALLGITAPALIFIVPDFLNPNGRMETWRKIFNWWLHADRYWLGVGTGSGRVIFQTQVTQTPPFNTWAHCDYLGVLFENGTLGLASVLLMLGFALWAARKRPWLFGSLCSYSASALINFPIHFPLHAAVGVALVRLALRG